MDIVDKLQGFPRLKKVRVCIGTNGMGGSASAGRRDNSEAWTKCMRYAEIGASVDKFLFLAAKSGSADVFYSSIGGGVGEMAEGAQRGGMLGGTRQGGQHRAGTSRQGEASFANGFDAVEGGGGEDMRGAHGTARLERGREEEGEEGEGEWEGEGNERERGQQHQQPQQQPQQQQGGEGQFGFYFPQAYMARDDAAAAAAAAVDLTLKQVMGPSDDSLKRMMPVIIFAIIRGFDEFRDVIPCLLLKLPLLKQLLLVDVTDNVTIHMRPHHMAQLRRANRRAFGGSLGLESLGSEGLGPESLGVENMVLGDGRGTSVSVGVGVRTGSTSVGMGASEAFGDEEFRPELLGAGAAAYTASLTAPAAAGSAAYTASLAAPSADAAAYTPSLTPPAATSPSDTPLSPARSPPPATPATAPSAAADPAPAPPSAAHQAPLVLETEQAPVLETDAPAELLSRRDLSSHPDSPNFHVSFWRTDRVRVAYPLPRQHQELTDVSVCVATQDSVALDDADVAELARSAVGGPVLAATVAFLNSHSSMHAL
ncbi:unnamed protein product [Closterium sp. Naga37s-1]|nr:unnamed protein product [Closterium sp. Naga37s-1]